VLLVLLGALLASAADRMRLYQDVRLTELRVYVLASSRARVVFAGRP
jgi:hypothetical protein